MVSTEFIKQEGFCRWFELEDHPAIYHCCFDKEHYSDDLFGHLKIHFPEQLTRAVNKRRAEFLAGRYCAANALKPHGFRDSIIGIGQHRNPLWPKELYGAISHCNNFAAAAITSASQCQGIGIDIEELVSQESAERLEPQILYGEERLLLDNSNKALLFTLAFSAKESFFKAAYPKVLKYFNFDAVSILEVNFQDKKMVLKVNYRLSDTIPRGRLVTAYICQLPESKIATLVLL